MFSERYKLYQRVVMLKNHLICLSYQISVTLFIDGGKTQNGKLRIKARVKDKHVKKRKKMITLYLNFEELLLLIKFVYNRSNSLFLFHFLIVKSILIKGTKWGTIQQSFSVLLLFQAIHDNSPSQRFSANPELSTPCLFTEWTAKSAWIYICWKSTWRNYEK